MWVVKNCSAKFLDLRYRCARWSCSTRAIRRVCRASWLVVSCGVWGADPVHCAGHPCKAHSGRVPDPVGTGCKNCCAFFLYRGYFSGHQVLLPPWARCQTVKRITKIKSYATTPGKFFLCDSCDLVGACGMVPTTRDCVPPSDRVCSATTLRVCNTTAHTLRPLLPLELIPSLCV